jgi:DDE superfamily endonuclease
VNETAELLAARAPRLRQAVRDAQKAGHAYVILDGTLIPVDRVAADRPFYSGKHRRHGMNLQVIASPGGDILWVSGALPGSVHDKKAEWIRGVPAGLEAAGLVTLAGKGYQGSTYAKIPYKGRNKPQSQNDANKAHARLRSPGERANAQLKTWRILRKLRCCPWRAGQLAKAIHVLQIREAYLGSAVMCPPSERKMGMGLQERQKAQ